MGPTSESAVNALLAAKGQANDGLEEVKEVQEDAEMKAIDEGEFLIPDGPDKLQKDDELRGVKLLRNVPDKVAVLDHEAQNVRTRASRRSGPTCWALIRRPRQSSR